MPSTLGIVSSQYTRLPAPVSLLLRGNGTATYTNTFEDSNFTITNNSGSSPIGSSFGPFNGTGGSAYFNGSTDGLSIPASSNLALPSDFTIEMWVNGATGGIVNGSYPKLFVLGAEQSAGCIEVYDGSSFKDGLVYVDINGTNGPIGFPATTLLNSTWNHFVITRSGTSLKAFVNGTQVGTTATNSTNLNSAATNQSWIGSYGNTGNFKGYISNFRIVKGVVYTGSTLTVPTAPLTRIANTALLLTNGSFDKSNNNYFPDISNNKFAITPSGTPTQAALTPFAGTGGSIYFDGGSRLTAPASSSFSFGIGDYTIEGWVYLTTINTTQGIWNNGPASGGTLSVYITPANKLEVSYYEVFGQPGSGGLVTGTISLSAGQWTHVAVTRSSGTTKIYVNGNLDVSAPSTGYNNFTNNCQIGDAFYNYGLRLNGYISNFRIVKGSAVYPTTPFPTSPLGNISGTSLLLSTPEPGVVDSVNKNPVIYTNGNSAITTSVKKYGSGSLYFDGSGDYLTVPATSALAFGTGDFTVEFWANSLDVSGSTQRGFLQTSDVTGGLKTTYTTGLVIGQGQSVPYGSMAGGLFADIAGTRIGSTTPILTTSTWYHIALVRRSGVASIYVNGNFYASGTAAGNCFGNNLCVGGYYNTSFLYNGYIDDLRITRGALYAKNFAPGPLSELPTTDPINLNLL